MNTYTLNISAKTPEDDDYFKELTLNKFPIIIIDDRKIDDILYDSHVQNIILKYIKTSNLFESAFLNIRMITNGGSVEDRVAKLADIMDIPKSINSEIYNNPTTICTTSS